jgi:pSer/pThr/pTyr-binding forkhead associated (FHA) protein
VQVHAVGDAELWVRVARRVSLEPHDVFKIGERRLCIAPTEGVLSRAYQSNTTHQPLTQSGPLSLLVFDPAGRLEALFPLSEGVTRLGRALADITLNDPSVSLSHAALLLEEGRVTLVDLSSDSGVWRLARAPFELHHNLVFSAGHTLFVAR